MFKLLSITLILGYYVKLKNSRKFSGRIFKRDDYMINYGEELSYWYFRLNGFFIIDNFVLHKNGEDKARKNSSEVDLLVVRFPYT